MMWINRIQRKDWILCIFGDLLPEKRLAPFSGENKHLCWEQAFFSCFWPWKATYTWLKFVSLFHTYILTTKHTYLFILWIPRAILGSKRANFRSFLNEDQSIAVLYVYLQNPFEPSLISSLGWYKKKKNFWKMVIFGI